jgi:hypothetical protein
MRFAFVLMAAVLAAELTGGTAYAQAAASPAPMKGYVEAVAQSAFGNVTSQSYGAEVGVNIRPSIQIFVEAGQTRNAATAALSTNAQKFAAGLGVTNVGYTVKEPVTFGVAGVKYVIPAEGSKVMPYLMAGFGAAQVKQNVTFSVGGTDVTNNLSQFGAILGTDLSGTITKPMLLVGGGVAWPVWRQLVIDFQGRFGRVFPLDTGEDAINITRAGIGIGVRF